MFTCNARTALTLLIIITLVAAVNAQPDSDSYPTLDYGELPDMAGVLANNEFAQWVSLTAHMRFHTLVLTFDRLRILCDSPATDFDCLRHCPTSCIIHPTHSLVHLKPHHRLLFCGQRRWAARHRHMLRLLGMAL